VGWAERGPVAGGARSGAGKGEGGPAPVVYCATRPERGSFQMAKSIDWYYHRKG
jgi:hypothetical protein